MIGILFLGNQYVLRRHVSPARAEELRGASRIAQRRDTGPIGAAPTSVGLLPCPEDPHNSTLLFLNVLRILAPANPPQSRRTPYWRATEAKNGCSAAGYPEGKPAALCQCHKVELTRGKTVPDGSVATALQRGCEVCLALCCHYTARDARRFLRHGGENNGGHAEAGRRRGSVWRRLTCPLHRATSAEGSQPSFYGAGNCCKKSVGVSIGTALRVKSRALRVTIQSATQTVAAIVCSASSKSLNPSVRAYRA